MPRRRGATNQSAIGRRTTIEDGRCNGNKKTTALPARSTRIAKEAASTDSPSSVQSVNESAGPEAASSHSQSSSDLGYLHKKFKKVAAAFATTPEPAPLVTPESIQLLPAQATATATEEDPAPITEPSKKEEDCSSSNNNSSSSNGTLSKSTKSGGRYVCPYCQHACAKPSVLEKHIRAHTNERPYPCVPCGFAFKTKSNLYKHCKSRTHVLKVEETGGTASAIGTHIDPAEAGSDDTSDDNAMLDDSDDGEPMVVVSSSSTVQQQQQQQQQQSTCVQQQSTSASSTPEKFKTPYKPKFHNLKNADDPPTSSSSSSSVPAAAAAATESTSAEAIASVTDGANRPSPGFLHERISQIISKNQAIVETLDPIWPRRYVRQSSRDNSKETAVTNVKNPAVPCPSTSSSSNKLKIVARERSCSLTVISSQESMMNEQIVAATIPSAMAPSTLRVLQESADESQRKRSYSEGPSLTDNQLSHSVRNLLHQPTKPARTDVVNAQNPEGSIIKDILLKSRGLLPDSGKEVDPPAPAAPVAKIMSSSFTVSALLNPSTTRAGHKPATISESTTTTTTTASMMEHDDPSVAIHDRPPLKRAKMSPSEAGSAFSRPDPEIRPTAISYNSNRQEMERMRTSLPLFGGEVEIHDGSQRTVMRIDPAGYSESNRLNGAETPVVIVTKANLNSGGGIVRIQPQESRLSVFPIIKSGAGFETTSCKSSAVPYIPGIPGPYSSSGWLPSGASTSVSYSLTSTFSSSSSVLVASTTTSSSCRLSVPSIAVHPPAAHPPAPTEERTDSGFDDEDPSHSTPSAGGGGGGTKFLRPNSLSLQPGTFSLKKSNMAGLDPHSGQPNMLCVSGAGMTLISPETPRPRKLFRQLYLNGHAYTYLGLKCSTRVYFCCLSRAQPMYVPHHPKLSMYSQWKTRAPAGLEASSPVQTMSLYDSRQRPSATTTAQSSADHGRMILTHSSYWTNRDRPTTTHLKLEVEPIPVAQTNTPSPSLNCRMMMEDIQPRVVVTQVVDPPAPTTTTTTTSTTTTTIQPPTSQPKRVRIFAGGYKSTEEYTYVRGRGRGRYVCEECGIRCKKPSMLKKHIRTHTDLRPYTCRQCNFSFKTKGNLTKHMKSKAHHKKCTELGIVPVPTTVDEANIDEDSLARQETLKKMKMAGGSGNEGMDSDLDDDDEDEDDEEEDEEVEGEEEEDETEEDPPPATKLTAGQFEDAAEPIRGEREQEVARSLLDLGVMAPAGCKPTTYPYATHFHQSVAGEPDDLLPPVHSVDLAEMKEEPSPVVQSKPHSQPMDLSTSPPSSSSTSSSSSCSSAISTTTTTSTLLASIYSSPVSYGETRRPLSPEGSVQPATSGMLQAYLTEKALKEGLMKRHQVKLTTTTPSLVHPVVTFFPATTTNSTSHKSIRPEFVVPLSSTSSLATTSSSTSGYKLTDDGKTACSICNKVFTKPSQLRLHINIHYFERPFRCEACAVSFRTKGHLQKHKRSVTHFNKVNMNLTFGTPSTENPRPFKCSDCMIAFRIHGHLAKHLRSKMHIMKLECLGKLPFGTYAEMERSGINLNEIDTTDCHNSLESLQSLAHRLYKQDPSKIQQWQQEAQVAAEASLRERTISGSSEEFSDVADDGDELDEDGEDSDGLPDGAVVVDEAPPPPRKMETTITENVGAIHRAEVPSRALSPPPVDVRRPPAAPAAAPPAMYCSACGESCASMEAFQMHVMEKHRPPSPPPRTPVKSPPPPTESPAKLAPPSTPDVGRVVNLAPESRRSPPFRQMEAKTNPGWNRADLQYPTQPRGFYHPATSAPPLSGANNMWPPRQPTFGELMSLNQLPAIPPQWHQDPAAMAWIASRHMMLPMAGHPQHPQHNYTLPHGHAHTANGGLQPRLYSPTSSSSGNPLTTNEDPVFPCELCGKSFTAKETLRQHMVAHAQPRPFVCEFCDAGFTTQKQLESHLVLHRPRTS